MDDIHAPTVQAGSPSNRGLLNGSRTESMPLSELIKQKDNIEAELDALASVLESHNVNMETSLLTFDGYPRDDLDVAQIRTTRARIIRLKNDYKAVMSKIEVGLHAHYASAAQQDESQQTAQTASGSQSTPSGSGIPETAFAKVSSVVAGSPAESAGLKQGDLIKAFGNVNWMNHEKLSKVAETVQRNEGRVVLIKVQRNTEASTSHEERELRLVPRSNWGGRGMLGCHIVPI